MHLGLNATLESSASKSFNRFLLVLMLESHEEMTEDIRMKDLHSEREASARWFQLQRWFYCCHRKKTAKSELTGMKQNWRRNRKKGCGRGRQEEAETEDEDNKKMKIVTGESSQLTETWLKEEEEYGNDGEAKLVNINSIIHTGIMLSAAKGGRDTVCLQFADITLRM